MAISIDGTLVVDETTGTQHAGSGSDSTSNDIDIAGGSVSLPTEFEAVLTDLSLSSTSAISAAVSGASAEDSSGTAMISGIPAQSTDLAWTDSAGAAFNGADSGLTTTDGTPILLFTYAGDNNVLLGRTGGANGPVVFAAYLDTGGEDAGATEAKVWLVQFESLTNPLPGNPDEPVSPSDIIFISVSQQLTFNLSGAPSGQNLFLMYGDAKDTSVAGDEVAIVVTASNAPSGGTVNTGQGGGGTTLGNFNQMLDPGEGLTFTFVTNAEPDFTVPNLSATEANLASSIQFEGLEGATSATFTVVQNQPSSKSSTLTIRAFNTETGVNAEKGANFVPGYADDTNVNVTSVVVTDANGDVVNLTVNDVGNGDLQIVGVKAGYTIVYTTDGDHNRVEIDNTGTKNGRTGAAFDIGGFSLISSVAEPFKFSALTFEDDAPSLAFGNMIGTGTALAQTGFWAMDAGADGLDADALEISLTTATLVRPDNSTDAMTFTFDEDAGSPDVNGDYHFSGTLTGDFDDNGSTDPARGFTLTAFDDGHYELLMDEAFGSSVTLDTANGALRAGGPDSVQTLVIPKPPAVPITDVVFFSAKPALTFGAAISADLDEDETALELAAPLYIDFTRGMNVSTSGIGVANNLLEGDANAAIGGTDESFIVNPEILVASMEVFVDNSVQGYSFTGGERLYYRVFYDDGSFDADYTLVGTNLGLPNKGQATSFVIDGGSLLIDAVQLTMAKGDVKIPHIVFATEATSLASDILLAFSATVTDGDGDSATSTFAANLNANDLTGGSDFVLAGLALQQDSFNIDLASDKTTYQVAAGFEVGSDLLVLIGLTPNLVDIDNSGGDSIVSITETAGGEVTTVTVVGVDLTSADIVQG
jgi:hypothetical protein